MRQPLTSTKDVRLTEHFTLNEFARSSTAQSNGINNAVPDECIPPLRNLCQQVLEPLRQHFGRPVVITSGYRCQQLNQLVGGTANSQHLKGEAADIIIDDPTIRLCDVFLWIADHCRFDQLIFETRHNPNGTTTHWIHLSLRPDFNQNRQHVLKRVVG